MDFYNFSTLETGMNTLQKNYKGYNFAVTLSLHYVLKLETT